MTAKRVQPAISVGIRKVQRACRGPILSLPNLPAISANIRKSQAGLTAENERLLAAHHRWNETRKYSAVEIGWNLLRAVALHRSDSATRFKPLSTTGWKDSTPERQVLTTGESENQGFYAWLQKNHPDIVPRTARNWMNAARNAGLSAESTLAEVTALRRKKALDGIALAKLYRAVKGDEEPQPDRFQAQRLMAEIAFTHGRSGLIHRMHETIIESASFAHLSADHIEMLYQTLVESTEKVAEHRSPARRQAA